MCAVLISLLAGLTSTLRTRASLQFEILALRHQLAVLQRNKRRRVRLRVWDRLVGSPCSPLAELAQDPHGGQARDGHRPASKRIPVLLELEEPPGTDGTTGCLEGNPRPDPRHELRQRALGRTEAARGTAEDPE